MYNQITIVGRWTRDTEITVANNGTQIMNGSLAVSDPYRKDHTDFIDVTAFKHLALNTNEYTQKGSKVLVSGKLQHERWEKDGQKRSKHVVIANQIVFIDDKPKEGNLTPGNDNPFKNDAEPIDISSDDLPF